MMMFQIHLALFILISAFHDGMAELLRSSTSGTAIQIKRRNDLWHMAGSGLYIISALPWLYTIAWWKILVCLPLIRGALFNPIRNYVCNEPIWYVGHTAKTDILLRRIAGINSAWLLSAASILLLLIFNILT